MTNLFSRMLCAIALFLLASLAVFAATVNDFYSAPNGVSILIKNNTSYPWSVNSAGVLVSGMHKDNRSASITYTNNSGRDLCCQFEWSVSSESNCDNLGFSCNGSTYQTISGNMYYGGSLAYQPIYCYLKAGQSLVFNYSKDGNSSSGDDCGYVRNLKFSFPQSGDTNLEWGFSQMPLSGSTYVSVIGYYGNEGDVTVPSVIRRNGVNFYPDYIEYDAFRDNSVLTSVVMNSGIEEIGVNAFKDCPNLVSVVVPNTVTNIDPQAFQGCKNLRTITLSSRLSALNQYVFDGCASLESIVIPSSVKSIGNYTFRGCASLESVNIPNSVTSLDYYAFDGCSGLKSVYIPASVSTINDNVFTSCKSIERIEVASGNPYYDSRNGCNAIVRKGSNVLITGCKNTVIPADVVGIGANAFFGSSELEHIVIPESVRGLGLGAFENCSGLKSIDLPSVMMIGAYAFYNCSALESVAFSEELSDIAHAAFYGCYSLRSLNLPSSLNTIDEAAFEYCRSLTSATIPASVTSLLADVFAYCENLKYLVVEGELTEVVSTAFRHCGSLSSVVLNNKSLVRVTGNRSFEAGYTSGHYTPFADCTLFVPASSVEAFSGATGWKQFGTVACIPSQAKNSIYAKNCVVRPSNRVAVPIMLNSEGTVSAFTFDMKLPAGFTLADGADAVVIDKKLAAATDFVVGYKSISNDVVEVSLSSAKGNTLSGSGCKVATLFLEVAPEVQEGAYYAELGIKKLVSSGVSESISEKSLSAIKVKDFLLGDVNQDGVVDCLDVQAVVSIILGQPQPNLLDAAADMNGDGEITVLDCSLIIEKLNLKVIN